MSTTLRFGFAALILITGCNHLECATDPALGSYAVASLNGTAVPALVPHTPQMVGDTASLQSGVLLLGGGTYTVQLTLQITGPDQGTSSIEGSGTYSINGNALTLTSSSGRQVTATLSMSGIIVATFTDPTYGTLSLTFTKEGGPHAC